MSTLAKALARGAYLEAALNLRGRLAGQAIGLLGVLSVAGFVNLWHVSRSGYGNTYYAAAVRSMLQSWHNFFFASYDPGGFISVDKPPVGLWIQAAFAKVFGYTTFAMLLPQALLGVASVLVLYLAVKRVFGTAAGLLAGLALALTPISVAVNRLNNLDTALVFFVVVAAYCVVRALESGSRRWLLLAAVSMGIAFNTKFLAAYVALPALWGAYLVAAPLALPARLRDLVLATAVLVVVSGAWVAAVDLTPASDRPYVGGSKTNSALNLLVDYNGLDRLQGNDPYFPAGGRQLPGFGPAPPGPFGAGAAGRGASLFQSAFTGGPPGALRLLKGDVAGQASWLAPLALIGGVAGLLTVDRRLQGNVRLGSIVLWGGWLLTAGVVFSEAQGLFHPYYLSFLGPAIGGMVGVAVASHWRCALAGGRAALLGPVALLATAALEVVILRRTPDYNGWLVPVVLAAAGISSAVLLHAILRPPADRRRVAAALGVALGALLLPPLFWTSTVLADPVNGTLPFVAPQPAGPAANPFPVGAPPQTDNRLIDYLVANRGESRFLVATESAMTATPFIIETGEPILAMGGFSGTDPAVSVEKIAQMVEAGSIRFFLLGGAPLGGGVGANFGVARAVSTACRTVSPTAYGAPPTPGGPGQPGFFGRPRLYDCQGAATAIRGAR